MSLFSETKSSIISSQLNSCSTMNVQSMNARDLNTDTMSTKTIVVTQTLQVDAPVTVNGKTLVTQGQISIGGTFSDVFLSSDGLTYTLTSNPNTAPVHLFDGQINAVAGDSQKWIAVENNAPVMGISYTGYSWEAHPSPPPDGCVSVSYLNNLWHCGTVDGLYYSTDGLTWTQTTGSNVGSSVRSIAYAQGKWVATGNGIPSQAYSLDGIKWFPGQGSNLTFGGFSVAGNENVFVANGYGDPALMVISSDGITWTAPQTPPASTFGYSVASNTAGDMIVAIGEQTAPGGSVHYSTNGSVWTNAGVANFRGNVVAFDGVKFVIGGLNQAGNQVRVGISYDGIHWFTNDINVAVGERINCIGVNSSRGFVTLN